MTDKRLPIEVKIQNASIDVGAENSKTNTIVLELTNISDENVEYSGYGSRGDMILSFPIGTGAEDLLDTVQQSENLPIDVPEDWKDKSYKQVSSQAVWTFRLSSGKVFQPRESKTLRLHDFTSSTAPGQAKLKISVSLSGYKKLEKNLAVEKKAGEFKLLYFRADPPYIATAKEKQAFTLKWNTIQAGKVVLYKNNNILKTFTAGVDGFKNGAEFIYPENVPDLNGTVYKLAVRDKADQKVQELQVSVAVLEPGWYPMSGFSSYGSPTALFNRDNVDLYGIFLRDDKGRLYSSKYPYSAWNLENEIVPDTMVSSPGVYFENQFWLVGGSRSDPGNLSSQISRYDIDRAEWLEKLEGSWQARMGHACIVFNKKLWIMGGMGATGNPLNDVHSLDREGNWQQHDDASLRWDPRCMFAATVFNDKIWVYGGCAEPFGDPLEDMWTSADGKIWTPYTDLPKLDDGSSYKPISCALEVVNGKLHLMGSFRKHGAVVEACHFILNESQKTWLRQVIDKPWDQQNQNTQSLAAVSFNGLVFVHSLGDEIDRNSTRLVLYVPRSR